MRASLFAAVLLSAKAKRQVTDAQTAGELWEVCCGTCWLHVHVVPRPFDGILTLQRHVLPIVLQVLDTDFWVVVPIESLSRPGEHLEGTRLTLVRLMDQPDAFELSIRTPVTPHRWKAFDQVPEPHATYWDVCAHPVLFIQQWLLWRHWMQHKLWRSMIRS